jgi:hypothetical protein
MNQKWDLRKFLPRFLQADQSRASFVIALALMIALGQYISWQEEALTDILDSSWMMVLAESWYGKLAFGGTLLWHYGPLGFLYGELYHPATQQWKIAILSFALMLFIAAAARLVLLRAQPKEGGAFSILVIVMILTQAPDCLWLGFPLLLVLHQQLLRPQAKDIMPWLLFFMTVVGGLIKFPYLAAGLAACVVLDAYRMAVWSKKPMFIPLYIASYAALWMMCGQNLLHLPKFLYGMIELSRGFGGAMSTGSGWIGFSLFSIGLVLLLMGYFSAWQKEMGKITAASLLAALLLLGYITARFGFTNANDYHQLSAIGWYVMLLLLLKDFGWAAFPRWVRKGMVVYVCVVMMGFVAVLVSPKGRAEIASIFGNTGKIKDITSVAIISTKAPPEIRRFNLREAYPLPSVKGTADIYNYNQLAIFAQDFEYHPRPVFQSYHAYTDYLAEKNRAFVASATAPQHIFFDVEPVNEHFPAQEDGASWAEIVTRYAPKGLYRTHLHFERRTDEAAPVPVKIEAKTARWNEPISLPEKSLALWAQIQMKPTLLGKIWNTLLTPPDVLIEVKTNAGYAKKFRYIPQLKEQMFLLSPLVEDTLQLAQFTAGGALSARQVKEMTFSVKAPRFFAKHLYARAIEVQLHEVPFMPTPLTKISRWQQAAVYARLMASPLESEVAPREDMDNQHVDYMHAPKPMLRIHGSARLKVALSGKEKTFSATYGIFNRPYNFILPTKGMDIAVYGVTKKGKEKRLWKESLTPEDAKNRVEKPLKLVVKRAEIDALIIETTAVDSTRSNWLRLTDVKIE